MYLKSIKAYGFKSFADKIEINFGKNINGIVGPNGSGKSNVVDAVRWVLGEQSVKSLRGESSVDIIFSGSKSRRALNSASVTLTFDNSDMYLPINYNEVSVRRVMYRTGENEYFLNNEKCRLKDITALLTDTGVDKESFNIISQGKIDEILSTKASDRRVIFESAAGVLKYKKRKEEALRKLERTHANVLRVNDIISELETNLEPLKKQSEDAKVYLDCMDELKEVEIALNVYDINNYNHELASLREEVDKINDELSSISSNSSSYDIDILTMKDSVKKIDDDITGKQSLLLELTKDIEKINANMKILREREKNSKDDDSTLNNILEVKENLLKMDNDINALNLEIESLEGDLVKIDNNLRKYNKEVDDAKEKKANITNHIDKNNRNMMTLSYKINYLENSLNNNDNLPSSIKNIMANPRISGYHNVIGGLIDTKPEYTNCISIALGGSTNYLVVDSTRDAKEMVNYLKDNNLGRATFFPLDVIKARSIDEVTLSKIKKNKGFVDVACNLVSYDDIYDNIIKNQLGNVIVCEDLDSANYISKMINNRYKIVTLAGSVVNVGGSITGGSVKRKNSLIQDKYELDDKRREYKEIEDLNHRLESEIEEINNKINSQNSLVYDIQNKKLLLDSNLAKKKRLLGEYLDNKRDLEREVKDLEVISEDNSDKELELLLNTYYAAIGNRDNLINEIDNLKAKKEEINNNIHELEEVSRQSNVYFNNKEREVNKINIKINTLSVKMDNLLMSLSEDYNMTFEAARANYKLEIDESIARGKVRELKNKIKEIGYVNVGAIEEFERIDKRYSFLTKQRDDLYHAKDTLNEIINELDSVMKEKFLQTFEEIRAEFKRVFVSMFKGGEAELVLTDPDNILETGIDIQAVPTGKKLKSLSLLSGGEKTFTAISLLFAILNVRPVPFCLLDEVEAALDDANVESFGTYLDKYRDKTQFILITHKKKTMEFADILYGITMQESGVSKLVSVRLDEIAE